MKRIEKRRRTEASCIEGFSYGCNTVLGNERFSRDMNGVSQSSVSKVASCVALYHIYMYTCKPKGTGITQLGLL